MIKYSYNILLFYILKNIFITYIPLVFFYLIHKIVKKKIHKIVKNFRLFAQF